MALDFGKINRSAAFNPTTAFPLDARCYFESYDLAVAAAASAKPAGDTTTTYYHGLTLVVVENNIATLYVIQPDGTLAETGGKIEINTKAFEFVEIEGEQVLNLKGFSSAVAGAQAVIGANGELTWVKPDTTTVEGLQTLVSTLEKDVENLTAEIGEPAQGEAVATGLYAKLAEKADASTVYTRTQTDSAIAAAVTAADHLKRKIVTSIDEIDVTKEDADQYIYMVPAVTAEEKDSYDEYMVINKVIEKVGNWDIDLTDYVTESELSTELAKKVDVQAGFSLLADTEIARLATINENAEENFIKSAETADFTVSEAGHLTLNDIAQDKITGLSDALDGKVAKKEGYDLVSNEEIAKLATVEEGAEKNYISAVSGEFGISEDGTLSVNSIAQSKVADLAEALASKVNAVEGKGLSTNDFTDEDKQAIASLQAVAGNLANTYATKNELSEHIKAFQAVVSTLASKNDLETAINGLGDTYVTKATFSATVGDMSKLLSEDKTETNLVDEILALANRLVWQELVEE